MTRRVEIRLLRHPQKVFGTGELTEEGIDEFRKLLLAMACEEFDETRIFLTPHEKRGRVLLPLAQSFHQTIARVAPPRICHELTGGWDRFSDVDTKVLVKAILGDSGAAATEKGSAHSEPWSAEQETRFVCKTIHHFWDVPFPGFGGLTGQAIGKEIQNFVDGIISSMHEIDLGSRILVIAISHSGIVEHFTKLVYLQNNPDTHPQDVSAEMLGGPLDFLEGPTIIIDKPQHSLPTIRMLYGDLLLPYKPAGPGRLTLED